MQFFIRSAPYMRAKWDERVKVNMWVLWWGEGYVVWKGGGHVINGKTEDSSMEERERERTAGSTIQPPAAPKRPNSGDLKLVIKRFSP